MLTSYLLKNIKEIQDKWELIKQENIGVINISDFPYLSDIDGMISHLDSYAFQTYFFQDNYNTDLNKIKSIINSYYCCYINKTI